MTIHRAGQMLGGRRQETIRILTESLSHASQSSETVHLHLHLHVRLPFPSSSSDQNLSLHLSRSVIMAGNPPPLPQGANSLNWEDSFFKVYFPKKCPEQKESLYVPYHWNHRLLETENPPTTVRFIGMSNDVWKVMLRSRGGAYEFTDGWPDFRRDQRLVDGDFMIFFRIQRGWFKVLVYDKACIPKQNSTTAVNSRQGFQRWEDPIVIPDGPEDVPNHADDDEHYVVHEADSEEDLVEDDDDYYLDEDDSYYIHFEVEVTDNNVGRKKNGIHIPNLEKRDSFRRFKVCYGDMEWILPCHLYCGDIYRIGKGWAAFVHAMGLQRGDKLVFELADVTYPQDPAESTLLSYDVEVRRADRII